MIKNSYTFNFKILLIPALITLALILAEAGFRLKYFDYDAILNYKDYTPNLRRHHTKYIESDYGRGHTLIPTKVFRIKGTLVNANKHGFRERNIDPEAIKNKLRIAVIGSSYSMGTGVSEKERYSNQLQIILDHAFPDQYEVLNFAVLASSIQEVISTYESNVIKFNPDIILYPPRNLKFIAEYNSGRKKKLKNNDLDVRIQLFSQSFLYGYVRYEFKRWYKKYINVKWQERLQSYTPTSRKENIEINIKSLEGFLQRRSDENASIILLGIPKITQIRPGPDHKRLKQLEKKFPKVYYRSIHSLLMGKLSVNDNIYPGDTHPNARAHKLYAEAIFKALVPVLEKIKQQ